MYDPTRNLMGIGVVIKKIPLQFLKSKARTGVYVTISIVLIYSLRTYITDGLDNILDTGIKELKYNSSSIKDSKHQRRKPQTDDVKHNSKIIDTDILQIKQSKTYEAKYNEIQGKCLRLIQSRNKTFVTETKAFMKKHPRRLTSIDSYLNITSNCRSYTLSKGYTTTNISETERRFPIAFSMMVYKHVDQIERLLIAIYRPQNVYCIHIDRKSSDAFYKALKSISLCLSNVFIASNRISVSWGTYSVLEQELVCLKELYNHKTKWRYVINLTGQEYPLKTNYQLVRILDSYKGANDILGSAFKKRNTDRIKDLPKPPHGIVPCKESLHMTASRGFIDYVLHNQTALDFLQWCKKMHSVPDETYFTTLNNNKHLMVPGSYTGDVENDTSRHYYTRYKVWNSLKDCGSRRFVRGICIQGIADLPTLTTVPHLFVNKFDYEFEPLAYDCLEQWYTNQISKHLYFNTSLYANSSFVKHRFISTV